MHRTPTPAVPVVRVFRVVHQTTLTLLLVGLTTLPLAASSADRADKAGAKAGKRPNKIVFLDAPSAESPAARDKRLRRECKGRPNAGACLGYTR